MSVCVCTWRWAWCQPWDEIKGCRLSVCRTDLEQCNLSCCPPSATQVLFCLDSVITWSYPSGTAAWHRIQALQGVQGSRQEEGWLPWAGLTDHIPVPCGSCHPSVTGSAASGPGSGSGCWLSGRCLSPTAIETAQERHCGNRSGPVASSCLFMRPCLSFLKQAPRQ